MALAGDAIHDLRLLRAAGDGAQQPGLPSPGLLIVAAVHERQQGEGSVAQPTVAVIPVPRAAQLLGQGSGDGSDDSSRGMIDE